MQKKVYDFSIFASSRVRIYETFYKRILGSERNNRDRLNGIFNLHKENEAAIILFSSELPRSMFFFLSLFCSLITPKSPKNT